MNGVELNKKPRKVMIVFEDDGNDQFKMYLAGDIERIGLPSVPISLYSASEFWGVECLKACADRLKEGPVKQLNRKERRKS